jgi:hypothetical protein
VTAAPTPLPAEYRGRLSDLLTTLTAELAGRPEHTWAFRLLRGGALVSLRRDAQSRRTLRIAREARPMNERARRRWESELDTFLRYLSPPTWLRAPDPQVTGIAALWIEIFPGEVRPGHNACPHCGAELPYHAIVGEADRCVCGWDRPPTPEGNAM